MKLTIEEIKNTTKNPGVYIMKDSKEEVIYVGKAKNLKKRLLTYIQKTKKTSKTRSLLKKVSSVETIVVNNEKEALLLELNLIKKHKPKYNIKLKNERNYYPFIKIKKNGLSPFFEISFKNDNKNYEYFGPYPEKGIAYQMVKDLNSMFGLRTCSNTEYKSRKRACIKYEMNLCSGPCVNKIDEKDYLKKVGEAKKILKGKNISALKKTYEKDMKKQASLENFEKAALLRDKIKKLDNFASSQIISQANDTSSGFYITLTRESGFAYFGVAEKVSGKIVSINTYIEEDPDLTLEDSFLYEEFISNFFIEKEHSTIITNEKIDKEIENFLNIKTKKPNKNDNKIFDLINKNLSRLDKGLSDKEILQIKKELLLTNLPYKTECFDISHFQGSSVVGAKSCFINGVPSPSNYRKYKLSEDKNDDFNNMKEILRRRLLDQKDSFPDLIVIDGGKGQLSAAQEVFKELNIQGIDLISLAKDKTLSDFKSDTIKNKHERVFSSHLSKETVLQPRTPSFSLLTKARDAAHNFAIKYHRLLRSKNLLKK